jgi:hypothetical protein
MDKPYRRNRKTATGSKLEAKFAAQKLAFAPLSFQAVIALRDLNILQEIFLTSEEGITAHELIKKLGLSEYGINTLLEVAVDLEIVSLNGDKYSLTKLGNFILNDEMTRINMDFVNDVCYQGAFYLKESLIDAKPAGLKVFGDWPTIYEALAHLPPKVQKSWFDFDHYYSDIAFLEALPIVFAKKTKHLFDIGGNTGKWAIQCLQYDKDVHITILDLPGQLAKAKTNLGKLKLDSRFSPQAINMLDETSQLPKGADAVWMSQFLDCFSKEQIIAILKKVAVAIDENCTVYIMEPFWDMQPFPAARFSLNHTSLYFTCMANGNSKMYKMQEMQDCIEQAGLKIDKAHHNLGENDYSLLEVSLRN